MICGLGRRFSEHLSWKCEELGWIPKAQREQDTAAHTYNLSSPLVRQEAEAGEDPQAVGPVSQQDLVSSKMEGKELHSDLHTCTTAGQNAREKKRRVICWSAPENLWAEVGVWHFTRTLKIRNISWWLLGLCSQYQNSAEWKPSHRRRTHETRQRICPSLVPMKKLHHHPLQAIWLHGLCAAKPDDLSSFSRVGLFYIVERENWFS